MTAPSDLEHLLAHAEWLARLARRLVADAATADDLVQDTWMAVLSRPPDPERPARPWLATVVRRLAALRARRQSVRSGYRPPAGEPLPATDETAARVEQERDLAEHVLALDEPYRNVVLLRYYRGLSAARIAREIGVPAATVRTRLKRGLARLRTRLEEQGGGRTSWVSALAPLTRARLEANSTLAASLITLGAMKLALASVLTLGGLAIVWTFASDGDDGETQPLTQAAEGPVRTHGSQGDARGQPEDLELAARTELPAEGTSQRAGSEPATRRVLARAMSVSGAPVPGAWLRLRQAPDDVAHGDDAGHLALNLPTSDIELLTELSSPRRIEIEIGAAGYRKQYLRPYLTEGQESLELGEVQLYPGGVVHGHVVDEAGQGLAGALVVFGLPIEAQPDDPRQARQGPSDLHQTMLRSRDPAVACISGPGGAFRLEGLGAGHGTAWARTATSLWAYSEPVGLRAGAEVFGLELVVRDAPGALITGSVVDPDGRPLPGLELTFTRTGGSEGWHERRTDTHGRFHFVPMDGAAQDIKARSPAWEWEDQELSGVPSGTLELVIAFEHSQWLFVAVQDQQGESVKNGRVVGLPGSGPTDRPLARCESPLDEEGRGRLRRPDTPLRVRVEAPGYRDQLIGPIDPAIFPDPLLVTLERIPALSGQVLLPDGRPAAGARVSLHRGASAEGQTERSHLSHQVWSGDRDAFVYELRVEPFAEVMADEQGNFLLTLPGADKQAAGEVAGPARGLGGLGALGGATPRPPSTQPNFPWYVHAAVKGQATITSGPHLFDPSRDVELDLQLPRRGSIAGRLVLADGTSTVGWTARASNGLAQVAEAPVGQSGSFHLEHLHAGGWQVRVFEPGRPYFPGRVRTERVPEPDIEVLAGRSVEYEHVARTRASARLHGHLQVDGAPPGPWRVDVRTSTPQAVITSYETTLDPDGRFEVTLEPGLRTALHIYRAPLANGPGFWLSAHPTIFPGDNEWSFAFETAQLQGTLEPDMSSGSAFGSAPTYESERGDVTLRITLRPDEEGRFGPLPVPAGPGILRGPRQDFRGPGPVWAELDLEAGETRTLDLH